VSLIIVPVPAALGVASLPLVAPAALHHLSGSAAGMRALAATICLAGGRAGQSLRVGGAVVLGPRGLASVGSWWLRRASFAQWADSGCRCRFVVCRCVAPGFVRCSPVRGQRVFWLFCASQWPGLCVLLVPVLFFLAVALSGA